MRLQGVPCAAARRRSPRGANLGLGCAHGGDAYVNSDNVQGWSLPPLRPATSLDSRWTGAAGSQVHGAGGRDAPQPRGSFNTNADGSWSHRGLPSASGDPALPQNTGVRIVVNQSGQVFARVPRPAAARGLGPAHARHFAQREPGPSKPNVLMGGNPLSRDQPASGQPSCACRRTRYAEDPARLPRISNVDAVKEIHSQH